MEVPDPWIVRVRLRSASTLSRWKTALEHIIGGTTTDERHVVGLGDLDIRELRNAHLERWREDLAKLVVAGDFSPVTINGWFAILRVALKAVARDHELPRILSLDDLDTSEHVTYTEEEPNSLAPKDVPRFLDAMLGLYPQHYGMTYLGFVTGLRPSSLRPLRRGGSTPDLLLEEGRLHVRRSHTLGQEVMAKTKTAIRYSIHLPPKAVEVLRWHIETQLRTPEQRESELLFPSEDGRIRSSTVLLKPFATVTAALELPYAVTPRGMRRTFQDLARTADVPDLITRSVSGHATPEMQRHYSTVRGEEQRTALQGLVDLMGG